MNCVNALEELYQTVMMRKTEAPQEGSYTCYLFEQGLDKILKKIGEESAEVIIAAKNHNNSDTANEICDLLYHIIVMMAASEISLDCIWDILHERSLKIGNLKPKKISDHNT